MMGLHAVFFTLLIIFVFLGAFRGWVKEILVTAAAIWGVALIAVLENYASFIFPTIDANMDADKLRTAFFARLIVFLFIVAFGYHSPRIARLAPRTRRESIRDSIVGGVLGLFNGFLILSTLWYYLAATRYPVNFILPPQTSIRLVCCQPAPLPLEANPFGIVQEEDLPLVDLPDNQANMRLQLMSLRAVENERTILRWSLPRMAGMPWILVLALVMGLFIIVVLV